MISQRMITLGLGVTTLFAPALAMEGLATPGAPTANPWSKPSTEFPGGPDNERDTSVLLTKEIETFINKRAASNPPKKSSATNTVQGKLDFPGFERSVSATRQSVYSETSVNGNGKADGSYDPFQPTSPPPTENPGTPVRGRSSTTSSMRSFKYTYCDEKETIDSSVSYVPHGRPMKLHNGKCDEEKILRKKIRTRVGEGLKWGLLGGCALYPTAILTGAVLDNYANGATWHDFSNLDSPETMSICMYAGIFLLVTIVTCSYIYAILDERHLSKVVSAFGVIAGTLIISTGGILDACKVFDVADPADPDTILKHSNMEYIMIAGGLMAFMCLAFTLLGGKANGKKCSWNNGVLGFGMVAGMASAGFGFAAVAMTPEVIAEESVNNLDSNTFMWVSIGIGAVAGLMVLFSLIYHMFRSCKKIQNPQDGILG